MSIRLLGGLVVSVSLALMVSAADEPPAAKLPRSLKGLSDEQLLAWMAFDVPLLPDAPEPGEAARRENATPANFWNLAPKAAALELARANASDWLKERYDLYLAPGAPEEAANDPDDLPGPSGEKVEDWQGIPHLEPLPRAWTTTVETTRQTWLLDTDGQRARLCLVSASGCIGAAEVPAADAAQIGEVLWYLPRVRGRPKQTAGTTESRNVSSTSFGHGAVTIRDAVGQVLWQVSGELWNGSTIPECWYMPEVVEAGFGRVLWETKTAHINFAAYLVCEVLVARLGKGWEPNCNLGPYFVEPDDRKVEESRNLAAMQAERFLAQYAEAPAAWSPEFMAELARLIGDQGLTQCAARLGALAIPPGGWAKARELALRQLAACNDPERLAAWDQPDSKWWALEQLGRHFPERYLQVVEEKLRGETGREAAFTLRQLAERDLLRARRAALTRRVDEPDEVAVLVFDILQTSGEVPDARVRIHVLLDALRSGRIASFEPRVTAVLVPGADPNRYPYPEIDETLQACLRRATAEAATTPDGEYQYYMPSSEISALALRNADRHAKAILAYELDPAHPTQSRCPEALIYLAVNGSKATRELAVARLRQLLQAGPDLVHDLWWTDLRELEPEVARFAVATPQEPARWEGHHARRVASLWREEDPLTRAKLLVAWGLQYIPDSLAEDRYRQEPDTLAWRFARALDRATAPLDLLQKAALVAFCDRAHPVVRADPSGEWTKVYQEHFRQLVRQRLLPRPAAVPSGDY